MRAVYFRVDGDSTIGLGHLIRCCALAEMLRSTFSCTFFITSPSESVEAEVSKTGALIQDMNLYRNGTEESVTWAKTLSGKEIVILDGYQFGKSYQQNLKAANCKLVCIDDIHKEEFLADAVINHSESASKKNYKGTLSTQYFLGFRYCLLRAAFLKNHVRQTGNKNLLISFGGADPANYTAKLWEMAAEKGFDGIHILTGSAYSGSASLQANVGRSLVKTTIHHNLDAGDVANLMQSCGYALMSASSIALEYLSIGGVLFIQQTAENQQYLKTFLLHAGLAYDAADVGLIPAPEKEEMFAKQSIVFDKKSPKRLLQLFNNLDIMADAEVSVALPKDVDTTFEWANDPATREMSFNSTLISKENHYKWYMAKIADPVVHYFLIRRHNKAFAQIRFEKKGHEYIVSFAIDPKFRGRGLGSFILAEGLAQLKKIARSATVVGYVKKENLSSAFSFRKLGFDETGTNKYNNSLQFTLSF
jgi:UDP-2,4-diacetamido-2,4,6-trideoxy-beta-L-altropyranose hydrolase